MREGLFLILAGVVALGLQATSLAFLVPAGFRPDMMLIVVVWAASRVGFSNGVFFAFVAGMMMDLFSGSPTGLFAVFYCLVFVCCGYVHATLRMEGSSGPLMLVLGASLAAGATAILVRWVTVPVGLGWNAVAWIFLKSLTTAGVALPVFVLIEWAWKTRSARGTVT